MEDIRVETILNGRKYFWDGEEWFDATSYTTPADAVLAELHKVRGAAPAPAPTRAAPRPRSRQAAVSFTPPPAPRRDRPVLRGFAGQLDCLRNDHPCPVKLRGQHFTSVNDALERLREHHLQIKPGAFREWEQGLEALGRKLLRSKFVDELLRKVLLDTGEAELRFTEPDPDPIWGMPDGQGENLLGRLLMEIRDEVGRGYLSHDDDLIAEHIREYALDNRTVPDAAIRREDCWARIEEVYDLNRREIDPAAWAQLSARRDALKSESAP